MYIRVRDIVPEPQLTQYGGIQIALFWAEVLCLCDKNMEFNFLT